MEDPQVKARKMITEILHPIAGPLRIASSPLNLSETPPHIESPAPALGQHTNLILKQLINADDQEISKWRDNSIIF